MRPTICGIPMRFRIAGVRDSEDLIAGPPIYASLACHWLGQEADCSVCLPADVSKEEIATWKNAGVDLTGNSRGGAPSLILETPPVHSDHSARIRGNPLLSLPAANRGCGGMLFCANIDPCWIMKSLNESGPALIAIDLHPSWLLSRPVQSARALEHCAIVTGTEYEMSLVPEHVRKRWRSTSVVTLVKQGPKGAKLVQGRRSKQLPAAGASQIRCTVGAGDLSFGFMAAAACRSLNEFGELRFDAFVSGYLEGRSLLAMLLVSGTPRAFCNSVIQQSARSRRARLQQRPCRGRTAVFGF